MTQTCGLRQNGVGLIEVLITILVIGLGVVGLLQANLFSLTNSHSAHLRTTASASTADMLDKLRSDKEAAIDGSYDIAFGDTITAGATMSSINLANWLADLSNSLPSGKGSIACVALGEVCTVGVEWDDSRGESGDSNQQFFITGRLL